MEGRTEISFRVRTSFKMNKIVDEALAFANRLADADRELVFASGAWSGEVLPMMWKEFQREHFGGADKTSGFDTSGRP
ncbi:MULTISPECIES: hypothetical protein [Rhizobium]|uniref:Uncharacterized protein n=1 Tax=Rhizobium gallicum bv. gallicum R602sp TaxID=1041138 RepID=A0A0B4XFX6_9HYPH|nr:MULTISPECIES: hypothetical protein [Rhizobium]AJD45966.1 hypothetical protein RGR602_PC01942 [Rhizobium gallicum bv. gallicum R602sp]